MRDRRACSLSVVLCGTSRRSPLSPWALLQHRAAGLAIRKQPLACFSVSGVCLGCGRPQRVPDPESQPPAAQERRAAQRPRAAPANGELAQDQRVKTPAPCCRMGCTALPVTVPPTEGVVPQGRHPRAVTGFAKSCHDAARGRSNCRHLHRQEPCRVSDRPSCGGPPPPQVGPKNSAFPPSLPRPSIASDNPGSNPRWSPSSCRPGDVWFTYQPQLCQRPTTTGSSSSAPHRVRHLLTPSKLLTGVTELHCAQNLPRWTPSLNARPAMTLWPTRPCPGGLGAGHTEELATLKMRTGQRSPYATTCRTGRRCAHDAAEGVPSVRVMCRTCSASWLTWSKTATWFSRERRQSPGCCRP